MSLPTGPKVYATAASALAGVVRDEITIMSGGFGLCGIAENLIVALRDSGARVIFVSTKPQLDKVLVIRDQVPVERIVVMDDIETPAAAAWNRLDSPTVTGRSVQFEQTARAIQPDDLATVMGNE